MLKQCASRTYVRTSVMFPLSSCPHWPVSVHRRLARVPISQPERPASESERLPLAPLPPPSLPPFSPPTPPSLPSFSRVGPSLSITPSNDDDGDDDDGDNQPRHGRVDEDAISVQSSVTFAAFDDTVQQKFRNVCVLSQALPTADASCPPIKDGRFIFTGRKSDSKRLSVLWNCTGIFVVIC